jgi:hypothetical protein
VVVPAGYTFVGSHVWPRAADPRSAAAELRTAALSSLRAILQATGRPSLPTGHASTTGRRLAANRSDSAAAQNSARAALISNDEHQVR